MTHNILIIQHRIVLKSLKYVGPVIHFDIMCIGIKV